MKLLPIIRHPLFFPLITGFVLRAGFMYSSQHIYYPDELYQSLEQAYRLVNGFGIIPWDFAYGLRSFVLPLMLAVPLYLLNRIGITDPAIYSPVLQLILILLSLLPIIAVYVAVKHITNSGSAARFTAFTSAIWYELIYMAPRALTEVAAVNFLALSVILFLRKKPAVLPAAFMLGFGALLRPQFFPLAAVIFLSMIRAKKPAAKTMIGLFGAFFVFAVVDVLFLHRFMGHLTDNIRLSYLSGISRSFGSQPWWFYILALTINSAGLWLAGLATIRTKRAHPVLAALSGILVMHSMIAHKEYRFIIAAIPLWIALVGMSLAKLIGRARQTERFRLWQAAYLTVLIVSIIGMFDALPLERRLYGKPLLLRDPAISLYRSLGRDPSLCGLYDSTRNWVYTPGYYHLNRQAPLYTIDTPPPGPDAISHYVTDKPDLKLTGFSKISTTESFDVYVQGKPVRVPGISVYRKTSGCTTDPDYSYYRSSPAVESVLRYVKAERVRE